MRAEGGLRDEMGETKHGLYVRARPGLRLRDEKIKRLARKVRLVCPWISEADRPTVRQWCMLQVPASEAYAVLRVAGITNTSPSSSFFWRRQQWRRFRRNVHRLLVQPVHHQADGLQRYADPIGVGRRNLRRHVEP